jgi:UDP-N-acetyl-D-mannosaminuronic acid dehydrogenase
MLLSELQDKIEQKTAVIGVIGLGYVGLPVAVMFADVGFAVMGVDIKPERVAVINAGQNPIEGEEPGLAELLARVVGNGRFHATANYAELARADIILIDVETPVDDNHIPQYAALRAVCCSLGPVLQDGLLVIVESTIAPGTIDGVVRPLLEEHSGKIVNQGFYLGACPERVMPGKLLRNLRTMSRVCGGSTPETAVAMTYLYRHIVQADLDTADPLTAELVKTTENAYRDVQIAFANEVALICEAAGGDVWRVRELVNKSPFRQMHLPGAGVGGHCIPKDPWLLAHGAQGRAAIRLIPAARAVNEGMPYHMADLLADGLAEAGKSLSGAKVAVLGYAYLENSDDTRHSPSATLVAHLQAQGVKVIIHDPWVAPYQTDLVETVRGCDAAVLMVAHDVYRQIDLAGLGVKVVVDGRNLFDRAVAMRARLIYRAVGVGA